MQRERSSSDGHWTDGALRVLAVWVFLSALIFAGWWLRIRITWREVWFILGISLAGAGLLSPVFGGIVYFGARRREQPQAARGALLTTIALLFVSFGVSAYALWVFGQAMSALR